MESPPTYEQVQQSGAAAQPVSTFLHIARALHPVLMDIRSSVRPAEELDDLTRPIPSTTQLVPTVAVSMASVTKAGCNVSVILSLFLRLINLVCPDGNRAGDYENSQNQYGEPRYGQGGATEHSELVLVRISFAVLTILQVITALGC